MKEATVQANVIKAIRARGGWLVKTHTGRHQANGTPDVLACYRGYFLAVEVKRPGGKPTKIQRHTIGLIVEAGGEAVVADKVEIVVNALDRIDRRADAAEQRLVAGAA